MNQLIKLTLMWAVLALAITACQSPADQEQAQAQGAETETSAEQPQAEAPAPATVLNANLATESDLTGLGLSAELVSKIMEARPFLTMQDLDALLGEEVDKAALYQQLFVPLNLNTTPEADFKMIPGVGDRMAHEFEEYRPYANLAQFRQEIGKSVGEEALARLERLVYVGE